EEDLPAVTGRGDARSPVHVDPDVALVRPGRLAGVQSHAHADRPAGERFAHRRRRSERVGRPGERDEERVPLSVHLDATVPCERRAGGAGHPPRQPPVVPGPAGPLPRRPPPEEPRRAPPRRKKKGGPPPPATASPRRD